jgi:hypothetical protein
MSRSINVCRTVGLITVVLAVLSIPSADAYIDVPPQSLGRMCQWSTHIIQVQIEEVDQAKGIVVWRRLKDYKGKWPGGDLIRQKVTAAGEQGYILQWAQVGRTSVIFALESYRWCHTYIDKFWYCSNTGDWNNWTVARLEPNVLRTYSGSTDKLQSAVSAILADSEVIIPCMTEENPQALLQRKARVQLMRASLKRLDYNIKRDFVAWGGDEIPKLRGMPGFSHALPLNQVGPFVRGSSIVDFDGDGRLDICLTGTGRTALFQNAGDSFLEIDVPGLAGSRGTLWTDYNGDGLADLLLIQSTGPKLFTNLGSARFRDDTASLPPQPGWNLQSAAWIDVDTDGKQDLVLASGHYGFRLYRNVGPASAAPMPPPAGATGSPGATWRFEDVTEGSGLDSEEARPSAFGGIVATDVDGDGRKDLVSAARNGTILLRTAEGFRALSDRGMESDSMSAAVFGHDAAGEGRRQMFVAGADGVCRLYRVEDDGQFLDVTATSGDLSSPIPGARCAAWGDLDNDGHDDLVVGCLKAPNRIFRNRGNGSYAEVTADYGMQRRIFNTQSVSLVDLNRDGAIDLVLNNEGQESVVLLGDGSRPRPRTPVVFSTPNAGAGGEYLVYRGNDLIARSELDPTDGRGNQLASQIRVALEPGRYRVERTSGQAAPRIKQFAVGLFPMWEVVP